MKKRPIQLIAFLLAGCLLCDGLAACSSGGNTADIKASSTAGAAVEEQYSKKGILFSAFAEAGGDGILEKPYNVLSVIPSLEITEGTHIYLERGSQLCGSLVLSNISGSEKAPVVVSAYADQIADYAVDAMRWAVENGLVIGDDNGYLAPQGTVERAELATFLTRWCEDIAK